MLHNSISTLHPPRTTWRKAQQLHIEDSSGGPTVNIRFRHLCEEPCFPRRERSKWLHHPSSCVFATHPMRRQCDLSRPTKVQTSDLLKLHFGTTCLCKSRSFLGQQIFKHKDGLDAGFWTCSVLHRWTCPFLDIRTS